MVLEREASSSATCRSCFAWRSDEELELADRNMEAVRASSALIIALAGIRKPKIAASSLGRKGERIRRVPAARGFPVPSRLRVSVPMRVWRLKVYSLRSYHPESE